MPSQREAAVVREEPAPGGSLGGEFQPARWDYVPGPQLPRQPGEVMVEPWVREALLRLNPEIAVQPDRADEVIYKLRACLLSVQADGLVRANENFMAWLRGEKTMPFGPDGDFSYEGMVARYNADLANNLGNLLSRVATLVGSKCGGIGPAAPANGRLAAVADVIYGAAAAAWDRLSPSEALEASWQLIREANAHLEDNEPWKSEPGPEVDAVLGAGIEALRIVAILASPAMPGATGEVWRRLGLPGSPEDQRLPEAAAWGGYPGGLPVEKGKPLFPRR